MVKKLKQLYRFFLDRVNRIKYIIFLNKASNDQSENLLVLDSTNSEIDLVTIAFNNPLMIEYQIQLLRKNITDKFTHIIADNSTDDSIRKVISKLCKSYQVGYVSIPVNNYFRNKSHGAAMHWVYKNVVKKRNTLYFGFLDHDIFPTEPYSILSRMKNNIYGRVIHSYMPNGYNDKISTEFPYWSLWAGFYFLKSDLIYNANVYGFNFDPKSFQKGSYLDTGGGLWDVFMSKMPYPGELATYSAVKFRESEVSNIKTDYYEKVDNWVHFVNISNWYTTPNAKEKNDFIIKLLSELLEK
jgi:hypothetical protein